MSLFNIAQLKKLCRIDLTPEEEKDLQESLTRVLDYAHKLSEIKAENVKPCRFVLRTMLKHQMRKDEVGKVLAREQFLSNTPDQIGGMVRVPPVLK
jgi:aspartyl-tRNA(Asn)/glutamyl-tRNA(Gln) amidotransferase subunit C